VLSFAKASFVSYTHILYRPAAVASYSY
jgi:hypothetical protein